MKIDENDPNSYVVCKICGQKFTRITGAHLRSKCIEFFGDYWHCNPNLYTENFTLHKSHGHTELQQDKERLDILEKEHNIKTLVVWEYDFMKDKDTIIQKCKEFLEYV